MQGLMARYGQSKFTLSFTNRVSPADYTHPSREYLTARWTDALACGAVVAGIPPRSATTAKLLWPGALLDIGTTDFEQGLHLIAEAVSSWAPDMAAKNHQKALERLDWRWRFLELSDAFGVTPNLLKQETNRLETLLDRPPAHAADS